MKAIGSFIIILFIICVCFVKCTSDRTKLMIYNTTDSLIQSQIEKCNERIEKEDSIQATNDTITTSTPKIGKRPRHTL